MQSALVNGSPVHRSHILTIVKNGLIAYSVHKLSSNVVEKCLDLCSHSDRTAMRELILSPTLAAVKGLSVGGTASPLPPSPLLTLILDQYGFVTLKDHLHVL